MGGWVEGSVEGLGAVAWLLCFRPSWIVRFGGVLLEVCALGA